MMHIIRLLLLILPSLAYSQKDSISVFFTSSDHHLDNFAKSKLDSILKINNIKEIYLYGYCDSTGEKSINRNLSERRTNSVRSYLSTYSFGKITIKSYPQGETTSQHPNFEKQLAFNRRVDIFLVRLQSKKTDGLFDLTKVKKGETIKIPNCNFKPGTHQLLERSYVVLDKLVAILKSNPSLKIELQGHICCTYEGDGFDPETGKNDLSVNRAKEVYNYLIQSGIDSTRLAYRGLGSSHKLVQETTEFNQALNRRVEILVVDL